MPPFPAEKLRRSSSVIMPRSAIRWSVFRAPEQPPIDALAFGVGHNSNPVSSVRGIDAASWNKKRLCFKSFRFQVSKHLVECQIDDSRHVLTKHPSGPEFPYNPEHFRPEVTVIVLASSLPGNGERLTRESTGNNVNCS